MILLTVEQVTKAYPEQVVLDGVTFGIHAGDRIGIIGANGSGKSTLLDIISGTDAPDAGQVIRRGGLRIAYLEQDPAIRADATIGDFASQGRDTLALLDRLGLAELDVPLAELSGGQRRRASLASALSVEAELLVLDEPTNHLDIDVIDWLEDHLANRSGALVLVTHDRYVLDRVCNRILEVHDGQVYSHDGTYEGFLEARRLREELAAANERKRRNLAHQELAWLQRNPKARTGKAKSRISRAEALQLGPEPGDSTEVQFELPTRRLGSKIINLHNVGKTYEERQVLAGVTLRLHERARIGVMGPNGSGKTTLLRLLAGSTTPDTGKVSFGTTISVGWYGQEPVNLPPDQRLLSAVQEVTMRTKLTSGIAVSASQLLERFLFPSQRHSTRVGELSGGERRRLELLRVLATAPNVLLLDEPTNDLDLDTLRSLETFLDSWPGALVTASHDRYFLDRVTEDLYAIEPDGSVRHHPGGWTAAQGSLEAGSREAPAPAIGGVSKNVLRPDRLSYHEQRELKGLGERIPALERQCETFRSELQEAGDDWEQSTAIGEALMSALAELEAAEDRWLDLSTRHS